MSKDEFERSGLDDKTGLYMLLRRDATGRLVTVPYHEAYKADLAKAAALLRRAAALSKDAGFTNYLTLRADALQSDDYQPSDYARSEEHTSELQSLMRTSYAVYCVKKTNIID